MSLPPILKKNDGLEELGTLKERMRSKPSLKLNDADNKFSKVGGMNEINLNNQNQWYNNDLNINNIQVNPYIQKL